MSIVPVKIFFILYRKSGIMPVYPAAAGKGTIYHSNAKEIKVQEKRMKNRKFIRRLLALAILLVLCFGAQTLLPEDAAPVV